MMQGEGSERERDRERERDERKLSRGKEVCTLGTSSKTGVLYFRSRFNCIPCSAAVVAWEVGPFKPRLRG